MPRPVALLASVALAVLIPLAAAAPPAAATSLVEVEPANGATLERAPQTVVLTFTERLDADGVSASVVAPGGASRAAAAEVDGARLVVEVPDAGTGQYVVEYSVTAVDGSGPSDRVEGSVGFAVDPDAEPAAAAGAGPWAVASGLAVAGLAAALLLTYRRVQGSR